MSPTNLTCKIIDTYSAWSSLEDDWRRIFSSSPTAAISLRWEWLDEWWQLFGKKYGGSPGGLRVIVIREEGKLVAALPLYSRCTGFSRQRLGFVGTGEIASAAAYPEKLDILLAPHTAESFSSTLKLMGEAIADIRWHEWDSGIVIAESPLVQITTSAPFASIKRITRNYPAPFADLSGGFEAYIQRQSSNARQQFRRILRAVPKENLNFEIARNVDEALKFFDELVELHQKRWHGSGELGAFYSPDVREFHRSLISRLIPEGHVTLARLGNSATTVAVLYGFTVADTFDFYQSGLTIGNFGELKSPGIAAHLLLMQFLAEQGIRTYDFLAGDSAYKDKLATGKKEFTRIRMFKLTLGNALHLACEAGGRIVKSLKRTPRDSSDGSKNA